MKGAKRCALAALVLLTGCDDHSSHHSGVPAPPTEGNAVQQEMQLLTKALEAAVRGIGAGDVRAVEHELHRVHAAKEATANALSDGTYRPPKNGDQLDRFRAMDEAFHRELVPLVDASRRNDVPGTAKALGTVLEACAGCHESFRP